MKRSPSGLDFSSDEEGDDLCNRAYDMHEQDGGGAVNGPLFALEFQRVGPRRR